MPLSRLIKTRSKVNVVEPNDTMEEERPPRFSIADLQTRRVVTTQRQLLHRQFSDTYAETLGSTALLDGSPPYLNKAASSSVLNQQIDNPSSPVATPEPSIDLVRPFGAPTGKLDIEQAIHLLQELKKTASPEELVSLHRALLPVKEVSPIHSPQIVSAEDSTFSTAIPPDRRRSVMPPGLATRNGLLEDILRKPQSCMTVHTASKESREMWVDANQNGASGKQNRDQGQSTARPETPFEQPNTGAYHPGTLRITNGAASPDPSIIPKIAAEARIADLGTSVEIKFGQLIWQSERPRPSGPRVPQRQSRANAEREANERQRARSVSASNPSSETRRASFEHANSVPTSPLKARYQQRWSHRAAHLSQQYLSDCEIGESPFDEKTAQIELMKRLSSVSDVEGDDGQHVDQHADAMFKLTGNQIDTNNAGSELPETQVVDDAPEHTNLDPPTRPLKKVDSGYHSDVPNSPPRQPGFRDAMNACESSSFSIAKLPNLAHEERNQTDSTEKTLLLEPASWLTSGEAMTSPQIDVHLPDTPSKRSSPLAFLRRNKVSERDSVSSLSDLTSATKSKPPPGSDTDLQKQPKKLQKRAPKSVRHRKQLEAEMQSAYDDSKGANTPNESLHSRTQSSPAEPQRHILGSDDGQFPALDTTNDGAHRFRLRGKSFGRKRSKTNTTEPSNESEVQTPPLRTRVRRGISTSSHIDVFSDSNQGSNCMGSAGPRPQSPDRVCPDFQTFARALSSHPLYATPDSDQSIDVPNSLHGRTQSRQETPKPYTLQSATQEPPRDVPMPKSPPRATLEGYERVIPIGANGSVEDLFPGWRSRPAASPSPVSTPSPTYLQVRQSYKPRSPLSFSSVPPLPELPADIESKLSRADQMVAKKMLNSPRNFARNSPLSSVRNSEDSASSGRRRSANRLVAVQDDEVAGTPTPSRTNRWSVDGTIPLPQAGEKSQTASPTHDSRHPGWPGWEKQADLWRQRKADLGHNLNRSVDMVGKIPVESESSPQSTPIVVSRHGTPLVFNDARNFQRSAEGDSPAEQLAQAYTYLLADDKENWPTQQDVQRPDSVDSSATMSSEDRSAMPDISRTGSEYSSSSSDPSMGGSPNAVVGKPAFYASKQSFTPYRVTDAAQAERSRALSRARRMCNTPPGSLYLVQSQNASMPQMKDASVLDRYSGGLGYGWDRSTGFGGSAGTLSSGTESANRKSVKISEDYGLDLSDVPVFLRKAHTGHF